LMADLERPSDTIRVDRPGKGPPLLLIYPLKLQTDAIAMIRDVIGNWDGIRPLIFEGPVSVFQLIDGEWMNLPHATPPLPVTEERSAKMTAILVKIVAEDPIIDGPTFDHCYFCGEYQRGTNPVHKPDCVYTAAAKLLGYQAYE
jgi:hypothetical protein